jgi:hypothetical protein
VRWRAMVELTPRSFPIHFSFIEQTDLARNHRDLAVLGRAHALGRS